jgi:hypothetical protein
MEFKQLQIKLQAAKAFNLAARLPSNTNNTSILVSILYRLALDHPLHENKRSRTRNNTTIPVTEAILECIFALDSLSRVRGISELSSTVNHHHIFGTSTTSTEDPVEAARILRNHESTSQQRNRTYPITLCALRWFENCIKLLVHKRTVVDLKENFEKFDADGDGNITRLEFLKRLQQPPFTKKLSATTLRQIVANFDQNGDDEVDFSEFVAFYFAQKNKNEKHAESSFNMNTVQNISKDEIDAANSIASDLHYVFNQFTGRGPDAIASENALMYKITSFVVETFVEHSSWSFHIEEEKYEISSVCLNIMHWILCYGNLGKDDNKSSTHSTGGSESSSLNYRNGHNRFFNAPECDAREFLLEALLEDRNLQRRLMFAVTHAARYRELSDKGQNDQIKLDKGELKLVRMTISAFEVLLDILVSDGAETPSERTDLAKSKLKFMDQHDDVVSSSPKNKIVEMSNSTSANSSESSIIAICRYISFSDHAAFLKMRSLAMKTMKELTSILAIVGASSRPSTVGTDRATLLRRYRNQNGGGGNLINTGNTESGGSNWRKNDQILSRNNLAVGLGRLLTEERLNTSLLSFFSKDVFEKFHESLFDCIELLDKDDYQMSDHKREKSELQCSVLEFVTACCHNQPNFGYILLKPDVRHNKNIVAVILNQCEWYYKNNPSVLASAYGLMSDIWEQGHGKRDRFLKSLGDKEKQKEFWDNILFPLKCQEEKVLKAPTLNDELQNRGRMENYCYRMEVCSFALRIITSQMVNQNESSIAKESDDLHKPDFLALLNDLNSTNPGLLLDQCFMAFCCFESPTNVLVQASKKTLELGVNLVLFEKLPVPPPGTRKYGNEYIYDLHLLRSILNQTDGEPQYINQVNRCMNELKNSNKMLSVADAQLFALQNFRQFMEVYCLKSSINTNPHESDDYSTVDILSNETIQIFDDLSKMRGVTSIVNQELTQLLLTVLHKKCFPSSLPMTHTGNNISGSERLSQLKAKASTNRLSMDNCKLLLDIMAAWCNKMFGHQSNGNKEVGRGLNNQIFDHSNIESVKSLLACCVLVFHAVGEKRKTIPSEMSIEYSGNIEKNMNVVIKQVCTCVEYVGDIIVNTGSGNNGGVKGPIINLFDLHGVLECAIALLSVFISQKRRTEFCIHEILRAETLRVLVSILWSHLSCTPNDLDLNPNSASSALQILSLLNELVAIENYADAIVQMGFLTHLLECPAFRHFQAEAIEARGLGDQWSMREYDVYGDRRDIHRIWCVVLTFIPALVNHKTTSLATRRLAFDQILNVVTIYEWSLESPLVPLASNRRFTRAGLEEIRCVTTLIASLIKNDHAQRWRLAKPPQFQRFIHGLLRVISSMAKLVRHKDNEFWDFHVKKQTESRSKAEHHEKILKLEDIRLKEEEQSQKRITIGRLVTETRDEITTNDNVSNVKDVFVYIKDHHSKQLELVKYLKKHTNSMEENQVKAPQIKDLIDTPQGSEGEYQQNNTVCVGVFEDRGAKRLIGAIQVVGKEVLTKQHIEIVRQKAIELKYPLSFEKGDYVTFQDSGDDSQRNDGEIVQVIETTEDVFFRVHFEKHFLNDCLDDAARVLEVVLPLICLPSLSPFDPSCEQRGLAGITFKNSQREKLDIAYYSYHSLDIIFNDGRLESAMTGEMVPSLADLRHRCWLHVRLLSQSLYLFWNHLQRNNDEESFGKIQIKNLKYLGIYSDSSSMGRQRLSSRSSSRSSSKGGRTRRRSPSTSSIDTGDTKFINKMKEFLCLFDDDEDEYDDDNIKTWYNERKDAFQFLKDIESGILDHCHLHNIK